MTHRIGSCTFGAIAEYLERSIIIHADDLSSIAAKIFMQRKDELGAHWGTGTDGFSNSVGWIKALATGGADIGSIGEPISANALVLGCLADTFNTPIRVPIERYGAMCRSPGALGWNVKFNAYRKLCLL